MPSKLNQLAKAELVDLFREVDSGVFVDFTGLGSEETYNLRKLLNSQNVKLRVVKTSLARLALREIGSSYEDSALQGTVGIAFGDDPVAVAKSVLEHRRSNRRSTLKVKGGFVERQPVSADDIKALSMLPGRQQLLGLVAGAFAAPITAFIGVQAEIIRKLLYALEALKDKREKE